jgi:hypothetical protein
MEKSPFFMPEDTVLPNPGTYYSAARGPIPTFASRWAGTFANVGIKGTRENIDSSGALDLTFAYECTGMGSERQIRSTSAGEKPLLVGLPWKQCAPAMRL